MNVSGNEEFAYGVPLICTGGGSRLGDVPVPGVAVGVMDTSGGRGAGWGRVSVEAVVRVRMVGVSIEGGDCRGDGVVAGIEGVREVGNVVLA